MTMKVDIYTRPQCPLCDDTKRILTNHNLDYTEHIIGIDITRDEVLDKFPGASLLPLVLLDDVWVGGRNELSKILRERQTNV